MLAHSERLRAAEVAEVLARGRSVRGQYLQMKFLPSAAWRAAAVVPKSLARRANKRNALRRALYRALAASVRARPKFIAVFMLRTVPPEPSAAFAQDIVSIFAKL